MIITAFDIDGTLTKNWFLKEDYQKTIDLIKKSRYNFNAKCILDNKLSKLKCIMIPLVPIAIITNRPLWLAQITNTWLDFHSIRTIGQVFADNVYQGNERIKYKTDILNQSKVNYYVEDEEELRELLKKNCPDTTILSPLEAINMSLAMPIGGH